MRTCHKCNTKLLVTHKEHGAGVNSPFTTHYSCMNGHTGTISGQVGTEKSEWAKKGAVWSPKARADAPDDHEL